MHGKNLELDYDKNIIFQLRMFELYILNVYTEKLYTHTCMHRHTYEVGVEIQRAEKSTT